MDRSRDEEDELEHNDAIWELEKLGVDDIGIAKRRVCYMYVENCSRR